jgi:hypothetical protein
MNRKANPAAALFVRRKWRGSAMDAWLTVDDE